MIPLFMVILTAGCVGFCAWNSPNYLRALAARMLARAEAIEARERAYRTGLTHWRGQLKCEVAESQSLEIVR